PIKFVLRTVHLALILCPVLAGAPARAAVPEKAVQRATERGVAGLKKLQQPNGQFGTYGSGSTALAALALLECDVPPDDECVRRAVAAVRAECPELNRVYHLSLAVMLFDRLG